MKAKRRDLARLSPVVAALTFAAFGQTASAADTYDDLEFRDQKVTLDVGPEHDVDCYLSAATPLYSGEKMNAIGGIKTCSPDSVGVVCSHQTELQVYVQFGPGPGTWETRKVAPRNFLCPPPIRMTTAGAECKPSSTAYSYRTLVVGSFVHHETKTADVTSSVKKVKCF